LVFDCAGATVADQTPDRAGNLGNIHHFVVLMLENRSFDHVLGAMKSQNAAVVGVLDNEFSNCTDPTSPSSPVVATGPAMAFAMPFDPGHEFEDVQIQLYGRATGAARAAGPRVDPAPMSGFVCSAESAAQNPSHAAMVMQCFRSERFPVLTSLAAEFALFNYWHSSLPGPTWPNRFFAHAGTSGGLSDSPDDSDILAGFTFPNGTLYQRLEKAGKTWRIYHDGLPQTAGIDSLRTEFADPFTENFREMSFFESDLNTDALPEYVFIEPSYDTGNQYVNGNSMHPLNDVRKGEQLVKRVYEAIRASRSWAETMLIITFDEHGGFFDHVPPPSAVPPGGDQRYANPVNHFDFDRLGVRVPAIVVSAYTQKSTIIGTSPQDTYDHTSIVATVGKRFALGSLTQRDAAARTLECTLNLSSPRVSADEAPLTLSESVADSLLARFIGLFRRSPAPPTAPLSTGQRVQLTLAHACNLKVLDPPLQPGAHRRFRAIRGQRDAADYIEEVEKRIRSRRRPHSPPGRA
jgi:phospholipase C